MKKLSKLCSRLSTGWVSGVILVMVMLCLVNCSTDQQSLIHIFRKRATQYSDFSTDTQLEPPSSDTQGKNYPSSFDLTADYSIAVDTAPTTFGTNLWWSDQDAELWESRWADLAPSTVRVPVIHPLIEPINDNYDPDTINWSGFQLTTPITLSSLTRTLTYEAWFQALLSQPNLNLLIYFPYLAPWLTDNAPHPGYSYGIAPHPPNNLAEYNEFVRAILLFLVNELGFAPGRIVVEAMNEPDLSCGVDPVTACFWNNWTMDDIADVVRATHEAAESVHPDISVIGLAECCGTSIVRNLLDSYPEGAFLDGLSYHYYSPAGFDLAAALNRREALTPYNRPLHLDEYGSREYLSEGIDGALWHSWALTTLWEAGVSPIQYPISEWPFLGEPYNSMGLFGNWTGDWIRKPAFWVYTNFFNHIGASENISHTSSSILDVAVVRRAFNPEQGQTAFWITNRNSDPVTQTIAVYNFFTTTATLHVYDNFTGTGPVLTKTITGSPLSFTATIPGNSSSTFLIDPLQSQLFPVFLPVILREAPP